MKKTIIVVPCYNEEQRLPAECFREFALQNRDKALLLVNDGSRDGTLQVLRKLEQDHPSQITALDLPQNVGKAEAIRNGFLEAFRSRPDFVGFWDADLATPLDSVGPFCEVLARRAEIQAVIGCRIRLQGHRITRGTLRHYLGRAFGIAASMVLGLRICDTQCGAKMFRVTPALEASCQRPFLSRWIFDVELLSRIFDRIASERPDAIENAVYEFPLEQWSAVPGSKLKSHDFVKAFWELLGIYIQRRGGRAELTSSSAVPLGVFPKGETANVPQERPGIVLTSGPRKIA